MAGTGQGFGQAQEEGVQHLAALIKPKAKAFLVAALGGAWVVVVLACAGREGLRRVLGFGGRGFERPPTRDNPTNQLINPYTQTSPAGATRRAA